MMVCDFCGADWDPEWVTCQRSGRGNPVTKEGRKAVLDGGNLKARFWLSNRGVNAPTPVEPVAA